MKKKILSLAAIAILAALSVSGTLAYYNSKDQAHNVITTDGVDIRLVEKTEIETNEGTKLVDFPEDGIDGVMPGTSVSKIVSVENTGSADAWIRVKVEMKIMDRSENSLPMEIDLPETAEKEEIPVMTINVADNCWLYDGEYYYYKNPVEPGNHTDTLFEEVLFAKEMGNEYQNCITNIIVSAQAVQTANNPVPADGDYTDIKGWPEA